MLCRLFLTLLYFELKRPPQHNLCRSDQYIKRHQKTPALRELRLRLLVFCLKFRLLGAAAVALNKHNPLVRGAGAETPEKGVGAGAAAAGIPNAFNAGAGLNRPPAGVGAGVLNVALALETGAGVAPSTPNVGAGAGGPKGEGTGVGAPNVLGVAPHNEAPGVCAPTAGAGAGAACGGAWSRIRLSKRRSAARSWRSAAAKGSSLNFSL